MKENRCSRRLLHLLTAMVVATMLFCVSAVTTQAAETTQDISSWDGLKSAVSSMNEGDSLTARLTGDITIDSALTIDGGRKVTILADQEVTIYDSYNRSNTSSITPAITVSGSGSSLVLGSNSAGRIIIRPTSGVDFSNKGHCVLSVKNGASSEMYHVLVTDYKSNGNNTGVGRVVDVEASTALFDNVEVSNFDGSAYGAFLYEKGASQVTLQTCNIHDCRYTGNSGGFEQGGGVLTVSGAGKSNTTLTVKNSTIQGNYNRLLNEWGFANSAGAFNVSRCTLIISDKTVISGNRAGMGGGIRAQLSSVQLDGVEIRNNQLTPDPNPWTNGFGWCYGAGMALIQCDLRMTNTTIEGNSGAFVGGGMMINGTSVTLDSTVNIKNNSAVYGGGLYLEGSAHVTVEGASIDNNKAVINSTVSEKATTERYAVYAICNGSGGGVALEDGSTLTVKSGSISNNAAGFMGGGVIVFSSAANKDSTLNVTGGTMTGNSAGAQTAYTGFTDMYQGDSVMVASGNFYLSGAPTISDEVFLASETYINVNAPYTGTSNIKINVEQNDSSGEGDTNDGTYHEGRKVIVFAETPSQAEESRFKLDARIKKDGYVLRNGRLVRGEDDDTDDTEDPVPEDNAPAAASGSTCAQAVEEHPCDHRYEWDIIDKGTALTDGVMRYQCIYCGDVKYEVPIAAYYIFNKETQEAILEADWNATVVAETPIFISFHEMVQEALTQRSDVTLVVDYHYDGKDYEMTIPAGSGEQLDALFGESRYAGFLYLGGAFATVEK